MAKDTGGPAFPGDDICIENGAKARTPVPGMSLRDYLAAKALEGVICNYNAVDTAFPAIAQDCYALADAMLAERAK